MRFRSPPSGGFVVLAVTGVNCVSFAIDASGADTAGLLGFAVERLDPAADEQFYMYGFKVFASVVPEPTPDIQVTTFDHPVQSLVWDDFTCKPNHEYTYRFHPLKGKPKNLDRTAPPFDITVRTERLYSNGRHDVFFNRGVASSQAYAREFGNMRPDDLKPAAKRKKALDWLSRDLDDAILKFIARAKKGDALRCSFYEFHFLPVLTTLKSALSRGVDVEIVIDAKVNEYTDKQGFHESFPRLANLAAIEQAGLPAECIHQRVARPDAIQHNKFMVLLKGAERRPTEVWTGSTNISEGGIYGQTNVGHWVRDRATAELFLAYWELLVDDPGAQKGDPTATVKAKNLALRAAVEGLAPTPARIEDIPQGITSVFSPRRGDGTLNLYFTLVDGAEDVACITLAFGINADFKSLLKDNTTKDAILFFLLEKRDAPTAKTKHTFTYVGAKQNIYEAWGSFLDEPLHQWAKETTAGRLGLNQHVIFIHSKFLVRDPLGADPIVVTGSANFSIASTNENDENMLIIRGDRRVADIYFTEFNRLFNHYYFRSVMESLHRRGTDPDQDANLFLAEDDRWLAKYAPGTLRAKRVALFTGMAVD